MNIFFASSSLNSDQQGLTHPREATFLAQRAVAPAPRQTVVQESATLAAAKRRGHAQSLGFGHCIVLFHAVSFVWICFWICLAVWPTGMPIYSPIYWCHRAKTDQSLPDVCR